MFSGKDFPLKNGLIPRAVLGLASSLGGVLQNSLMERIYVGKMKCKRVLENVVLCSEGPLTGSVTWATPLSF